MTAGKASCINRRFASFPIACPSCLSFNPVSHVWTWSKKDNEIIPISVCFTVDEKKQLQKRKHSIKKINHFHVGLSIFSPNSLYSSRFFPLTTSSPWDLDFTCCVYTLLLIFNSCSTIAMYWIKAIFHFSAKLILLEQNGRKKRRKSS